jgi:DNA-binding transcriptional LysR family regulator
MAQPPLSRQIQDLEEELGFQLFERSRRRVDLTPAGDVLQERVRHLFAELERAVDDARRASLGETGRVGVGYVSSLAYSGIAPLLRDFRASHPDIEVSLRELPPQQQLDALKDGSLQVGFVRTPVEDDGVQKRCLRRERLVVALPVTHPLARRRRIDLAELAHEPFVMFPRSRGPTFFDHLITLCRAAGFSPRIVQEAPQLDLVSLVIAGFGVAILPDSMRALGRVDLALRPIVGNPTTDLSVVWRSGPTAPAVQRFLDFVVGHGLEVAKRAGPARAPVRKRKR